MGDDALSRKYGSVVCQSVISDGRDWGEHRRANTRVVCREPGTPT